MIKEELSNLKMLDSLNMEPFHYKVLVVDDEEPVKRLIVTLLSQKGHQCIAANSGFEALEKIKENKFDAVVAVLMISTGNDQISMQSDFAAL